MILCVSQQVLQTAHDFPLISEDTLKHQLCAHASTLIRMLILEYSLYSA